MKLRTPNITTAPFGAYPVTRLTVLSLLRSARGCVLDPHDQVVDMAES